MKRSYWHELGMATLFESEKAASESCQTDLPPMYFLYAVYFAG